VSESNAPLHEQPSELPYSPTNTAALSPLDQFHRIDDSAGECRTHVLATRQSHPVSDTQPDVTAALGAIERLTDALADERRQLTAASVDRQRAEREREEARIEAARLQARLEAERVAAEQRVAAADADRDELRAQLAAIAGAGPIRALRLRRELRLRIVA
jgi:septal ring factor EnvC (AmiA/AmiB activator)